MYFGICGVIKSPGSNVVGALRDLLCRFVYNCEIWHRCRSEHNKFIFWGRQSRHLLGPPYWINPSWPPLAIWFCHNCKPKSHRIVNKDTFDRFLTSRFLNLHSVLHIICYLTDLLVKSMFYIQHFCFVILHHQTVHCQPWNHIQVNTALKMGIPC